MITATISGIDKTFEVANYTVQEYATPLVPGDTSGGTGDISLDLISTEDQLLNSRVLGAVGARIVLLDSDTIEDTPFRGRGTISGTISSANERGSLISIAADPVLNRLNSQQSAEAFFGVKKDPYITTYIVNLATNPSLETATTNWGVSAGTGGTAALARLADATAYAGGYIGRLTWSVAATGVGGATYTQSGLSANTVYSFSAYVRTPTPQQMRMTISWRNASNAEIGTTAGVVVVTDGVNWGRLTTVSAVSPAGTTSAVIELYNDNTAAEGSGYRNWAVNDTLDVDAAMVTQGSTLYGYGDGSSLNGSWQGTANASPSQLSVLIPQDQGYDATVGGAFRYYLSLAGIPATSIVVDGELDIIPVAYPAWTGNLLDMVKAFCAANMVEVGQVNDLIYLRRPRQRILRVSESSSLNRSVSTQSVARTVDINNYNNAWHTDTLAYSADTAYQMDIGKDTDTYVSVPHSLTAVNSPICVASINPRPYASGTGQYVVSDSKNNVVNPQTWIKAGGYVSADLDPVSHPGTIHLHMHAPATILSGYTAPYRLTEYPDADRPALYITGSGVFVNKEVVSIDTGTSAAQTSRDSASTVDNIFIGDIGQAHARGSETAATYTGPTVNLSFSVGYDPDADGQEFGNIAGKRVRARGGVYRIMSASITPSSISGQATMDMTFDDLTDLFAVSFSEFNATYLGLTFSQFDALFSSTETFTDFNSGTKSPTFDDYNAIYSGASFNAHAVYPYLGEAVTVDTEARF